MQISVRKWLQVTFFLEWSFLQTGGKNLWHGGAYSFDEVVGCAPIQLPATSCQHMDGYFRFVLATTRCATLATENMWKHIPETNLSLTNTLGYLFSAPSTIRRKRQIHWKNKLTLGRLWTRCSLETDIPTAKCYFFELYKVCRRNFQQ